MFILKRSIAVALLLLLLTPGAFAHMDPTADTFTMFAWRSVGWFSNDIPHAKIRAWLGDDTRPGTGETGQAEQGWHEMHPQPGPQTASFFDRGDAYPTIAGPVTARNDGDFHANATIFDMVMYWPYQADVLVWGQPFTRMGQTFIAKGYGLDKVSLYTMGDPNDLFAVVRKGGPAGEVIGPSAAFRPGPPGDGIQPGWQIARWLPGDVPLEEGKTYYIEIQRESAQPFSVRMHSTGNVYPDGIAYFDGRPEPASDLGVFLSFSRDDMIRSPVLMVDRDNWARRSRGVYFRAKSENIRAIYSDIIFPDTPFGLTTVFRVYKVEDGKMVRVGPEKQCNSYAAPGSEHFTGVLYAADQVPLEIGEVYFVEIVPKHWEQPDVEDMYPRRDLNVRIYGEKVAGMTPVIFNQHIVDTTQRSIKLVWEGTMDCDTRILYGADPYNLNKTIRVPRGSLEAEITPLDPGSTANFRFVLTTKAGGRFETPVYQARTLDRNNRVVTDPPLNPTPKHQWLEPPSIGFMNLAVMDHMYQPPLPRVRTGEQVAVTNASFDGGLRADGSFVGWETSETGGKLRSSSRNALSGIASVGWDARYESTGDDQTKEDMIYQRVRVTPGKKYMLTSSLFTLIEGNSGNWYSRLGELGDVRARLICDPMGGTQFDGHNSTQWFRTDGRWLQFAKVWEARSNTMTIGVSFQRRVDWPRVAALADDIRLVEVRD